MKYTSSQLRNIGMMLSIITLLLLLILVEGPKQKENHETGLKGSVASTGEDRDDTTGALLNAHPGADEQDRFEKELLLAHTRLPRAHGLLPLSEKEQAAGILKRQLSVASGKVLFDFYLVPQRRCMMGDADLIEQDLKHAEKHGLFVTIERLLQNDPPVGVFSLRRDQLATGANIKLAVQQPGELQHFGLFVCSSKNTDRPRCSDKPIVDFSSQILAYSKLDRRTAELNQQETEEGLKRQLEKLKLEYQELAKEKTYYFAYISLSPDAMRVLPVNMSEEQYTAFAEDLAGSGLSAIKQRELLQEIRRYHDGIQSVPLNAVSDRIQLILPRFDPASCRREQAEQQSQAE